MIYLLMVCPYVHKLCVMAPEYILSEASDIKPGDDAMRLVKAEHSKRACLSSRVRQTGTLTMRMIEA